MTDIDQSKLVTLCDASEVKPDQPARAEVEGMTYAVFLVDGQYYVTQDLCTHGPGSLSEGFVEGCEIECPFHQGKFDIKTGAPTAPPCTDPLQVWKAHVIDGKICIDPS
jgi:nitrite reductase/ring-hydroxylating ferredoxin subunit